MELEAHPLTHVKIRHLPWVKNDIYARDKTREVVRLSIKDPELAYIHLNLEHAPGHTGEGCRSCACCKVESWDAGVFIKALAAEKMQANVSAAYAVDVDIIDDPDENNPS